MARLKAHGTELFRMVKTEPADADGCVRKTLYAIMSDGKVLRKQISRNFSLHTAYTYDSGWKLSEKLSRKHAAFPKNVEEVLISHGYSKEKGVAA